MKVGIIGDGNVGSAIRLGLEKKKGYEVKAVGHDPKLVGETTRWGEILVLAVPYSAIDDTVKEMGDGVRGKVLVDATNVLKKGGGLAVGFTTSGAEELQKKAPGAKVVKAFNTAFAQTMSTGKAKGETISLFAAGDDAEAKKKVLEMGKAMGFEPVDAGPLQNARWLETMALLIITLGYVAPRYGTDIGFKLVGLRA